MATAYLGRGLQGVADVGNATAIPAQYLAPTVNAIRTSGYAAAGLGAGVYVSDPLATAGLAAAQPRLCKQSLDGRYWRLLTENGINAMQFGVAGDGTTDDTVAGQAAADAAAWAGVELLFPAGTYLMTRLTVPSNVTVRGAGRGVTILKLKNAANQTFIQNSGYGGSGNTAIQLLDFTVDANGANQTAYAHALAMDQVTGCTFAIECKNARGAGFAMTNSSGNSFLPAMICKDNGLAVGGYGLYIANSSRNTVVGGRYDNNCIGIAIEGYGGGQASNNTLIGPTCFSNRADFGQSGAGVHLEQNSGGTCAGNVVNGATCALSTGGGIVDSGTSRTQLTGCSIYSNNGPGIATAVCTDFVYSANVLTNNSLVGSSAPYRDEMRFDDTGSTGSKGLVTGNVLTGSAPDGGIRCLSVNTAVEFVANKLSGYGTDYSIGGTASFLYETVLAPIAFAQLPTSGSGLVYFVTDGTPGSNPLTGGGTGCAAIRQNGAWKAIAVGSGAGGAVWGAMTGTLSDQADLQSALNAKLNVSQASAFGLSLIDDADAGAARTTLGILAGTATVTLPGGAGVTEWSESFAASGVSGGSRVTLSLGTTADTDENDPEFLAIASLQGNPGSGTITADLTFLEPTSGPIKLNWSAL